MAQRRKDYAFEVGDRVVFRLYGIASMKRFPGVVTSVAPRGPLGSDWDYKVLLDDESVRPESNPSGEALVREEELVAENPTHPEET